MWASGETSLAASRQPGLDLWAMSDCDRVRAALKLGPLVCCDRCHQLGELTLFNVRGVGHAHLCCMLAGHLLPMDRASGLLLPPDPEPDEEEHPHRPV